MLFALHVLLSLRTSFMCGTRNKTQDTTQHNTTQHRTGQHKATQRQDNTKTDKTRQRDGHTPPRQHILLFWGGMLRTANHMPCHPNNTALQQPTLHQAPVLHAPETIFFLVQNIGASCTYILLAPIFCTVQRVNNPVRYSSTSSRQLYYYRPTLVIAVGHSTPSNTLYHNLVVVLCTWVCPCSTVAMCAYVYIATIGSM
jgi:hypothetical protein